MFWYPFEFSLAPQPQVSGAFLMAWISGYEGKRSGKLK